MKSLVKEINGTPFTDSLIIAEGTGNQHSTVRRIIKRYKTDIEDFGTFLISNPKSTGGRPLELILLNEEQATFVITLLRNSKKVVAFKKELVRQFYDMRQIIFEHSSPHWQATRIESKANRRLETDEIKEFVNYATMQGSKHADKYYLHFTRLANKAVGIDAGQRDVVTVNQLNNLILIEHILSNVIKTGIAENLSYKQIYAECKDRIEKFKEVAYLAA